MLKRNVGRAPSFGRGLMKGQIWAVGWTLLASMGAAWLLNRETLRMEQMGYASMVILLVSGVMLARMGSVGTGKDRIVGAAVGVSLYFLGLLSVNWLFFGGTLAGFGVTLLVLLAGTVMGSMGLRKGGGGASPRHYKIPKP